MQHQNPKNKTKSTTQDGLEASAEGKGGKTMAPPAFSVAAGSLNNAQHGRPNKGTEAQAPLEDTLQPVGGITAGVWDELDATTRTMLATAASEYAGKDWERIWELLVADELGHELLEVCHDIYHSGDWVLEPKARRLGVLDDFEYGVVGQKETQTGYVEVVEHQEEAGIRAIVPYGKGKGAHGGDVILHPHKTTTVLGRFIDVAAHGGDTQAAVDAESGTNYFRFQENFKVGENKGGGNVLSIEDYSWALNNAWLQAAMERGDVIRFVSDPMDPFHLLKDGNSIKGGLTITGQELGVLMNLGYAPDPETSIVRPIGEFAPESIPRMWKLIAKEVSLSKVLDDIDENSKEARFGDQARLPNREPEVRKDRATQEVVAKQTNFFGYEEKSPVT